jgi:tetratricopeptide (TPR) repeat protein
MRMARAIVAAVTLIVLAAPQVFGVGVITVRVHNGHQSYVAHDAVAMMFDGDGLALHVSFYGERDRSVTAVLSGPGASLIAIIETADGTRVADGCLAYESLRLSPGDAPVDSAASAVEIPPRGSLEAFGWMTPCGGALAPGRYKVRWGTIGAVFGGNENGRPYFFDGQTLESRRAATFADEFSRRSLRATFLMCQENWEGADRVLEEALFALPSSSELYHLRALVAEELSDPRAALEYAERAVALIETREDTLIVERRAPADVAGALKVYRAHRDRLRGGLQP